MTRIKNSITSIKSLSNCHSITSIDASTIIPQEAAPTMKLGKRTTAPTEDLVDEAPGNAGFVTVAKPASVTGLAAEDAFNGDVVKADWVAGPSTAGRFEQ